MTAPTQTTGEWISQEEAAKMLGVSKRQVQRLAARGLIRRRHIEPGKGSPYGHTQVDGAKILEMTRDRQAALRPPGDDATGVAVMPVARSQSPQTAAQADFFIGLSAHLAKLSAAYPAPAPALNPWLTLEEAAEFSGLTKSWLAKEAGDGAGAIATRDMGKHARGGRWRFFRGDLERAE